MTHRAAAGALLAAVLWTAPAGAEEGDGPSPTYTARVRRCVETLMAKGTDRYGPVRRPILVSILDVGTHACPREPEPLDQAWRVIRPARRNPAGANLLPDQPLLRAMFALSEVTGVSTYAEFANRYAGHYMEHLADEKGFLWWGWHRHYDVYRDRRAGHAGNHHEIHAFTDIAWDRLWAINPAAVRREIEAIWQWHVIDKQTGEINRHGNGRHGCNFSMSAGAYIQAFAFMFRQTRRTQWRDRARLLADHYWDRRNPKTDLFPERPNAGRKRFDGRSFVTAITGPYCHALLEASRLTGAPAFRRQAVAYLEAYARYGFDAETGKFWGALRLDGTPVPGPRMANGYAKYEPRGHLDLWEPYVAGYQYPIYTAQCYALAYDITRNPVLLTAARRFADWIRRTPTTAAESENTWYHDYTRGPGRRGTYAGKYGRTISFFLHLHTLTGEAAHLRTARRFADEAVDRLYADGLFRGHPAKPYYESVDGVGYLLYALLQLDQVIQKGEPTLDPNNW